MNRGVAGALAAYFSVPGLADFYDKGKVSKEWCVSLSSLFSLFSLLFPLLSPLLSSLLSSLLSFLSLCFGVCRVSQGVVHNGARQIHSSDRRSEDRQHCDAPPHRRIRHPPPDNRLPLRSPIPGERAVLAVLAPPCTSASLGSD